MLDALTMAAVTLAMAEVIHLGIFSTSFCRKFSMQLLKCEGLHGLLQRSAQICTSSGIH